MRIPAFSFADATLQKNACRINNGVLHKNQ